MYRICNFVNAHTGRVAEELALILDTAGVKIFQGKRKSRTGRRTFDPCLTSVGFAARTGTADCTTFGLRYDGAFEMVPTFSSSVAAGAGNPGRWLSTRPRSSTQPIRRAASPLGPPADPRPDPSASATCPMAYTPATPIGPYRRSAMRYWLSISRSHRAGSSTSWCSCCTSSARDGSRGNIQPVRAVAAAVREGGVLHRSTSPAGLSGALFPTYHPVAQVTRSK
jgi:hypothetical protein